MARGFCPHRAVVPARAPHAGLRERGRRTARGRRGGLVPGLCGYAGWEFILLLLAVFPANVQMALHPSDFGRIPTWALYLRLPLQFVLIAWGCWALGLRLGG
ncbi:DoxX family protein [Salinibacter altiplanensis]|uniref:DoxX family protein n=1 Tax=Salinibacter altiplanensis TaxID=1803181 RepID=UPI00131A5D2F|nr:hypothetical protein [Salinibacter altiplanensis]